MDSLTLAFLLFTGVCRASGAHRIIGGDLTTIDRYPSIAQVESLGVWTGVWSQSCGASILTSRFVLSAAHCFDGITYSRENRRIRAGSSFRNTGGQVTTIVRENNHPSYGSLGFDSDISVVELENAFEYNPVIAPSTIIVQDYVFPDNTPVIKAGWGQTEDTGSASDQLRDVTVYTINNELCRERYLELPSPGVITENMICAGILDAGGKDACQGDSGGPLYYHDASDTLFLVGVVSFWGGGCANDTYPGVSTAVSSYTNWIIETAQ